MVDRIFQRFDLKSMHLQLYYLILVCLAFLLALTSSSFDIHFSLVEILIDYMTQNH